MRRQIIISDRNSITAPETSAGGRAEGRRRPFSSPRSFVDKQDICMQSSDDCWETGRGASAERANVLVKWRKTISTTRAV